MESTDPCEPELADFEMGLEVLRLELLELGEVLKELVDESEFMLCGVFDLRTLEGRYEWTEGD
jgi:hypothetical protein